MASPASTGRNAAFSAVASTIAFLGFTVWWLVDGGTRLDATMLRFTGWLLRGWLDLVISASWPLGEPQFALAVVAEVPGCCDGDRWLRGAVSFGGRDPGHPGGVPACEPWTRCLTRLYPSGHTARVPFLGTAVAAIAPRPASRRIVVMTAIVAIVVALDRTDSRI